MSMPDKDWPKRLLSWFDANKRDLPWRESKPRNPYHVWVSEIMLQQTRTEAVKPYYESWMARFPTIKDLADADEQDVLHQWQGLGYYSRARNLHKAAREMEEKYGSEMPDTADEVRALPGIGDYTAGAILSIAFGKKEPAVDGNVLRVYARLYGIEDDVLKTAGRKKIRTLCEETIPERAGDFNEALMDLGANVCIPKRPRCSMCPLSSYCLALKEGREEKRSFLSAERNSRLRSSMRPVPSASWMERFFSIKGPRQACSPPCGNSPWSYPRRQIQRQMNFPISFMENWKDLSGSTSMSSRTASGT